MSDDFRPINWTAPPPAEPGKPWAFIERYVAEPIFWGVCELTVPWQILEERETEHAELNERLKDQWQPRLGPNRVHMYEAQRRLWPLGIKGRPAGPFRRAA